MIAAAGRLWRRTSCPTAGRETSQEGMKGSEANTCICMHIELVCYGGVYM